MDLLINIIRGFNSFISPQKKSNRYNTPLNANNIVWSVVPQFIFNIKENRIITSFNDPLWLDKDNNIKNEVITYRVDDSNREELIKKINRSKFTIVYKFEETEWKMLLLEDFTNHPKYNSEKRRFLIANFIELT